MGKRTTLKKGATSGAYFKNSIGFCNNPFSIFFVSILFSLFGALGCQTASKRAPASNEQRETLDLGPLSIISASPSHWSPRRTFTAPSEDARLFQLGSKGALYRVESFGNTKLRFQGKILFKNNETRLVGSNALAKAQSNELAKEIEDHDPLLRIYQGDETVFELPNALLDREASGDRALIKKFSNEIVLKNPGVYFIEISRPELIKQLVAVCLAFCDRSSIGIEELVESLNDQERGALVDLAQSLLISQISDSALAASLVENLRVFMKERKDFQFLKRFPLVTLDNIGKLQIPLSQLKSEKQTLKEDETIQIKFEDLYRDCSLNPNPEALTYFPVGSHQLFYGHFEDQSVSPCQREISHRLAKAFYALALNNGSFVEVSPKLEGGATESQKQKIISSADLAQYLLSTGHEIQLRLERTFANFLGFGLKDGRDIRWPTWIDTQIPSLSPGKSSADSGNPLVAVETLKVPTIHGQLVWRIRGPLIDARITFYLGIRGAGFFAQTDRRPVWTGMKSLGEITQPDEILKSFDMASVYLRRNQAERQTIARGLPADGYGILGICNDSTAVIENSLGYPNRSFPLIRTKKINDASPVNDGLTSHFRLLPSDVDRGYSVSETLKRLSAALPYKAYSKALPDQAWAQTLKEIESRGKAK